MSILLVFNRHPARFLAALEAEAPKCAVHVWPTDVDPSAIRYIVAWKPAVGIIERFTQTQVIFSYGAGVDHLLLDPGLPKGVPIVRLVEPDLTQRMSEYVLLHTLMHHRRMTEYLELQRQGRWHEHWEPVTQDVRVGVMGLGVLGRAAAEKLRMFGYRVAGWSRTRRAAEGVECYAGMDELDAFLARTEILIALLPDTPATRGIIDARLIGKLATNPDLPGPVLINAGRGRLHVETDVIEALNSGALYAASLDVFEAEPLPAASPLWQHPRVVITPHNASNSPPAGVARYVLEQIARHERGLPLANVVDPAHGY
jgi:glyoxylate/hydroxypyruvate reductase A